VNDAAATGNARKQAMKTLHICACCYFKGNDKYLLPAKAFGIEQRTEYYSRSVHQNKKEHRPLVIS